jgi:hypothetical protein
MTDDTHPETDTDLEDPVVMTEEERIAMEERKAAKKWQYGQQGDRIDTTIGHMGGAGAAASGPDISKQSEPETGNSSDEPGR